MKSILFKVGALFISLAFIFLIFTSLLLFKIQDVKNDNSGMPFYLSDNKALRKIFLNDAYIEFTDELRKNKNDKISTTIDFNLDVLLDKDVFDEVLMYDEKKYIYKPNAVLCNLRLWTGLFHQAFVTSINPHLKDIILECDLSLYVEFQTTDLGFKPVEFNYTNSKNEIFFLGDSFTEGLYIHPNKTFSSLVVKYFLNKNHEVQTYNLGVNGYSLKEMSWILSNSNLDISSDLVVLNLYPNDVHFNENIVFLNQVSESNYSELFKYLQLINSKCKQDGADLLVSIIPSKQQFTKYKNSFHFQNRIKKWCNENRINNVDVYSEFKKIGIQNIYFTWDPHFSEEGHRHYAEFIYSSIAKFHFPTLGMH